MKLVPRCALRPLPSIILAGSNMIPRVMVIDFSFTVDQQNRELIITSIVM
jgi:hypothetical protein